MKMKVPTHMSAGAVSTFILLYIFASQPTLCTGHSEVAHLHMMGVEEGKDFRAFISPIGKELLDCDWYNVVILCDRGEDYDKTLYDFLLIIKKLIIPFTVYRLSDKESSDIIYKMYAIKRITNFVIISKYTDDILIQMNDLFHKYSLDFLSAFPQRSHWLLLNNGSDIQANNSVLDNVASVQFHNSGVSTMKTLMWRERRTRQWSEINVKSLGISKCGIFPNMKNGMNGRNLSWLVQLFSYGVYVEKDSSGKPYYAGFFVDVVEELAEMLNYTKVFLPPPDQVVDAAVSNYSFDFGNVSADLGLNLFSEDYAVQQGLKGIFPLLIDSTVAAYMYKKPSSSIILSMINLGSFHYPIQVIMVGVFFYTVVFYKAISTMAVHLTDGRDTSLLDTIIRSLKCGSNKERDSTFSKQDNNRPLKRGSLHRDTREKFNTDTENRKQNAEQGSTDMKKMCGSFVWRMCRVLRNLNSKAPDFEVSKFLGSHFNQSTIMRPEQMSSRLFIFFWCLYVLLITCLFTGTLTATFIQPQVKPPLTSVTEVLKSKDVTYGTFAQTELVARSKSWSLQGNKTWTGQLHTFPFNFTVSPEAFRQFMEEPASKPKVFLYYAHVIKYLKYKSNFTDLYITRDTFQTALLGFVAHKNSEIADVLSGAFVKLRESGLIRKWQEPYIGPRHKSKQIKKNPGRLRITIAVLTELFYAIAICTGVAAITIGFEKLFHFHDKASISHDSYV